MHRVPDYWYLFKLAVKAVIFVVIFGTLGWLSFVAPSNDRPMPATPEAFIAESISRLPPLEMTKDGDYRMDIAHPLTGPGGGERQIWGPWQYPATPETWTARDAEYARVYRERILAEQKGAEASPALLDAAIEQRIASKRRQSSDFCQTQEEPWLDLERKFYKISSFTVTQWGMLQDLRKTQAECQYWKAEAARRGDA